MAAFNLIRRVALIRVKSLLFAMIKNQDGSGRLESKLYGGNKKIRGHTKPVSHFKSRK